MQEKKKSVNEDFFGGERKILSNASQLRFLAIPPFLRMRYNRIHESTYFRAFRSSSRRRACVGYLLHRLRHARDADGKEHFQRMGQEIHDNPLSSAQVEFRQNSSAHPSPCHSIPLHSGTSPCPPPQVKQRDKLRRESVPPDRLSVSIRLIRLIRLFFFDNPRPWVGKFCPPFVMTGFLKRQFGLANGGGWF